MFKRSGEIRKFGWCKINFDDSKGVQMCGLWYAPIKMVDVSHFPPSKFDGIQRIAKMSGIAIPLHYMLGKSHADANKYCVLTNWWRERNCKGNYVLPSLDFERYKEAEEHT